MKINYLQVTRLLAAVLSPVVAVSCADRFDDPEIAISGDRTAFEFAASIEQDNSSRADESGFADGDRFGAFVVNYDSGSPGVLAVTDNQANNVAVTFDASSATWSTATDIYWRDGSTPVDVYGYYPFNNALADVEAYSFEVRADQSIPATDSGDMSAYEASDFLWAKSARVAPGTRINLAFTHRLAGVKVMLQKGTGFTDEEWAKLPRIVTVDNTLRSATVNLSTGVATATGTADRHVVMNPDAADSYRAVVVPQKVAAGKSTVGITIDGVNYTYTRDGGMEYAAGKLHNFTLRIDKKEQSGTYTVTLVGESISPWEADSSSHDFVANSYFVVDCQEAGTLKDCIMNSGADLSTIKNLKVTGRLTNEDFRVIREEMDMLAALNLKEIKIVNIETPDGTKDDVLPDYALDHKESLRRLIIPDNITRIGNHALAHLRLTSTLILPETVTVFDDWAVSELSEEATLVLPNSIEYIGEYAFWGTTADFELRLATTIKHIGVGAFENCSNAYGVFALPPYLEYLGDGAFNECGSNGGLTGDIVIPMGITEVPRIGVHLPGGTNLVLHEGITAIKDQAFTGMKFKSPVIFPKNLKTIGNVAFLWTKFVGELHLPEGIEYIGHSAFAVSGFSGKFRFPSTINVVLSPNTHPGMEEGSWSKTRITDLEIGDNVVQIEKDAFCHNGELRNVTIGKNVSYIGENAFMNCPVLEKFVILSKEPPTAFNNTFEYSNLDRAILEVPEGSVDLYRHAEGWRRFSNITEHHELTVDISEIACLDKGVTRQAILRSEGEWTVTECPSWVHVTPSSGSYKTEIEISVDSQSADAESREGRVVFSLKEKDYTTYITVRQLHCNEAGEDVEIVLQQASAGAPAEVPMFIVGDGFPADQLASGGYMNRMRETMEQFFAVEPYKSMREYFTVSTALACSPDDGSGDIETPKLNCFGIDGVTPDVDLLRDYVKRVSPGHAGNNLSNALIIVVSNYNAFTGWSTIDNDGCSIAGIGIVDDVYPYDQRGLVQYFAGGEAFAGLGNEGIGHFHHIKGCPCQACAGISGFNSMKNRGFFENLSMSSKMNEAPWREFIFHPKYSQTVDMWEGGYNHLRGVWRSEPQSVMSTYVQYYNTISRYAIYKGIMRRAGLTPSLDDFIAKDKIEIPQ